MGYTPNPRSQPSWESSEFWRSFRTSYLASHRPSTSLGCLRCTWCSQGSGRHDTTGTEARQDTHTSLLVSALHLLPRDLLTLVGVALTIASFAVGRVGDVVYRRYKTKHNGENPPPERRLDIQMYAYFMTAAGKIMFGWFVSKSFHPAAGLVASALGE
jgi:hypothetical protein